MSTRLVIICLSMVCALATGLPAWGLSFYLTTDSPAALGGVAAAPWDIVRSDPDAYTLKLSLPPQLSVNALHKMDGAGWVVSLGAPGSLCGTMYDPRDVIGYDGASCILLLNGGAAGIPLGSSVDAVTFRGGDFSELVVSFDVPTTIGGITFEPADLVRWNGFVFTHFLDASALSPPVPASTNVTGADLRGVSIILAFDVPTTLGVFTYQPGELVYWDGMKFGSYWSDPAWPAGARIDGLAFLADPGVVGATLNVRKVPGTNNLSVSWNPSCSSGAEDYAIYEGRIGNWYEHEAVDCHDNTPSLAEEITPNTGSHYYLVVPLNPNDEGSYGRDSDDLPRPAGVSPCVDTRVLTACP
jgi:hypothetical protein